VNDLYATDEALAHEAADVAAGYVYDHMLDGDRRGDVIDTLAIAVSLVLIALIFAGQLPV
jgi:hypothetical protein